MKKTIGVVLLLITSCPVFSSAGTGNIVSANQPVEKSVQTVDNSGEVRMSDREREEFLRQKREQRREIDVLNFELEKTRLQAEREKMLQEINGWKKDNKTTVANSGLWAMGNQKWDVKLVFLEQAAHYREAILNINGQNFAVREGDRPTGQMTVKQINGQNVILRINDAEDVVLNVDFLE
ncbi:MAG: hypothetical protein HQL23_05955 [Candidatus Omnitrophica bacterium]|nr:hypothetical protein [Candidatus Omnitrophota bacterium]